MSDFYDRLGVPITLDEWGRLQQDDSYKIIAHTVSAGRWLVSTVWLGLDHNFWFDGPPIIFETMVFDLSGERRSDLEQRRYATEAQARDGHDEMVDLVRTLEGVPDHREGGQLQLSLRPANHRLPRPSEGLPPPL